MNEISILMHLLTKKIGDHDIGATKKEILESLNVKHRSKGAYFHVLITNLSNYVEPLGLRVQFNPLNSHWFISFDHDMTDEIFANPFNGKIRLAATLFCVLASSFKNSGIANISEIKELRNKKNILDDLKELEGMNYIQINKETGQVHLTPLIGYQLNLEKLLLKLALYKFKGKK